MMLSCPYWETRLDGPSVLSGRRRPFARLGRILALALALLSGAASAAEPLAVLYNARPPHQVPGPGSSVTGLTADPVAYALRKAGIPFQWVAMPSARQLLKIQENRTKLAAVGWFKNPEREKFAKFSHPIYQDRQIAVLARADHPRIPALRTTRELLDDGSLLLLRKLGYSYGQALDERIDRSRQLVMTATVENISMIQMIHARRADYMFISPEEAGEAIRLAGFQPSDFQVRSFPDMPPGEKRYLMFSLQVDDETIRLVDKYLDEYHAQKK